MISQKVFRAACLFAACTGFGATGCAAGGSDNPTKQVSSATLQSLLLDAVPSGYTANPRASGALDLAGSAYSTPAKASDTRGELAADHFTGGYSRVWSSGSDYITAAVYSFAREAEAQRFMSFEKAAISQSGNGLPYALSQPPDGIGFVISSPTKAQNRYVFCQGGMFTRDTFVFLVEVCRATPVDQELTGSLTANQFSHAIAVLGSAEPAPPEKTAGSPVPASPRPSP
jgi:hypothetical protein